MEIPFSLHFLRKIETFQILKKLENQFKEQFKIGQTIPTWEVEKKLLFWAYNHHKHLGSPLLVKKLISKRSFATKFLEEGEPVKTILSIEVNEFEEDYKQIIQDKLRLSPSPRQELIQGAEITGNRKQDVKITAEEADKVGIREVFGNLVSRGYARYYPEIQSEFIGYEKDAMSPYTHISRAKYKDVPVNQMNCEGIFMTEKGMMMGELLNDLFKLEEISPRGDILSQSYKKRTNSNHFLLPKKEVWYFYNFFIFLSYLILLVATFLMFEKLWYFLTIIRNFFQNNF